MTALAPASAHTLQNLCFGRGADSILVSNLRLLVPKANYRRLPNNRATMRQMGDVFRGWVILHR